MSEPGDMTGEPAPQGRGMPCQEVVEHVTGYLEGALDPAIAGGVEAHLRECEGCRTYLTQTRATIAALRQLRGRVPPP